ncbi:MAG: hypothetical protein V3573_14320 [Desulfovibrionaceae bacterium]
MATVFYFVSSAFVWNDKIIPVVLELARQGNTVYTVFPEAREHEELRRTVAYYDWLERYTEIVPLYKTGRGLLGNLGKLWHNLLLKARLRFSRGYLALFDTKPVDSKRVRRCNELAMRRGRVAVYPPRYDNYRSEIDEETLYAANRDVLQKRERSRPADCHDSHIVLAYSIHTAKNLTTSGAVRLLSHPKLQSWWSAFLIDNPPLYDREEIVREKEIIPVFLTHFGNFFFEEGTDLDTYVLDIIRAVRRRYPDTLIVLKPKFTVDVDRLRAALPEGGMERVVISSTPVSILAGKALFGITVCQTSAQFEFLCAGKAWIEYCRYSGFWKEMYPPETYTPRFGGIFSRYFEELEEAIDMAGQTGYDLDAFKRMSGFVAQDIDFDFFANEPKSSS